MYCIVLYCIVLYCIFCLYQTLSNFIFVSLFWQIFYLIHSCYHSWKVKFHFYPVVLHITVTFIFELSAMLSRRQCLFPHSLLPIPFSLFALLLFTLLTTVYYVGWINDLYLLLILMKFYNFHAPRENRKEIGSWTGFRVFIREALDPDSVAVRDLFQTVWKHGNSDYFVLFCTIIFIYFCFSDYLNVFFNVYVCLWNRFILYHVLL